MTFKDRHDAGKQLADKLKKYKGDKKAIVLGLPRGGVVTASEVASTLNLPLDIIVTRKMGAPYNPELAIGAVDDLGHAILNDDVVSSLNVSKEYIEKIKQTEQEEAADRLKRFRSGRPCHWSRWPWPRCRPP